MPIRRLWLVGICFATGFYVMQSTPLRLSIPPVDVLLTRSAHLETFTGEPAQCNQLGYPWGDGKVTSNGGNGKRVLVTGAAGFIASHVAKHCLGLGMEVVGVDDLSGGFVDNIPTGVLFYQLDVKNASALEALFVKYKRFDYVYHLAAYAAEGLSHFVRSYNYRNNLVGGVEVVNYALKYNTSVFVFTSSIAVYGSSAEMPVTERTRPEPEDPYGVAKYAMELDLKVAHETHGMKYVIFRPHNVYGPHQNIADKYRNVIGIFMNNILGGRPMTIFGDGNQTRCFSFIDDVAPLISKAPLLEIAHNQVFNIGSDEPSSLNQLAAAVGKAMGSDVQTVHLDRRHEVDDAQAWHAKLRCAFNPPPPTPLLVGLKQTADWVTLRTKQHGFEAVEFRAVEVLRGMPRSWVRPSLNETHTVHHTAADNPRYTQDIQSQVHTIDSTQGTEPYHK